MREVYGLIGLGLLFAGGFSIVSPVLPEIAGEFGVGSSGAGLVISAYAASRMLVATPTGILSERFRIADTIRLASGLVAGGSLLALIADDFMVLLAARAVQGAGSAVFLVATTGHIIDVAPRESLARMLALNQSLLLVGLSLSPTLGGISAVYFGYRGPFAIHLTYALIALVASEFIFGQTPTTSPAARSDERHRPLRSWLAAAPTTLAAVALVVAIVAISSGSLRAGVRSAAVPLHAAETMSLSAPQIGGLLTLAGLANLAAMYPIARCVDRYGWRRVLTAIMPVSAVSVAALALARDLAELAIALVGLAVATGFLAVIGGVLISDIVPVGSQKPFVGMERSVRDLASMASPPLLLAFASTFSFAGMYVWTGVAIATLGIVATVLAHMIREWSC